MPAPYSLDFRKKIVESYENNEGSLRKIADRFKVSFIFVQGLVKRYKTHGSIEPLPHGGGNPGKIQTIHEEFIKKQLEEKNDLTLKALCSRLKEKFGIEVSIAAMHVTLKDLGFSCKKKLFTIQKNMKNGTKKKQ